MEILEDFQRWVSQKQTNAHREIAHLILTELCKMILIRAIKRIAGQSVSRHHPVLL